MDSVLRNAVVIDGSGNDRRHADLRISGGRIAEVAPTGTINTTGTDQVDLDGLVLTPGFIDIHTHYDAQITWDPNLTPSSWHGVTTAVLGNCGFGVAPTTTEHRETIARTLENVEGMSYEALAAGLRWGFETFPEYLSFLEELPKTVNVAAFIGHTPIRIFVLGEDASDRAATSEEIARMRALVAEGIAAGAVGFSTSRSPGHVGDAGKPVPSRLASLEEVFSLAGGMRDVGRGIFEIVCGPDLPEQQLPEVAAMLGRPITYTALLSGRGSITDLAQGERPGAALEFLDRVITPQSNVVPQIACRPIVMQVTLEDPVLFFNKASFKAVLEVPRAERANIYAKPEWRDVARKEVDDEWGQRWHRVSVAETGRHNELVGIPLDVLSTQRGVHPFDLMVDLSLADGLATRFLMQSSNTDEDEVGKLLQDPRPVLGVSDGGAHGSQQCDACFSTYLLQHWVRELEVLTLEQAVWRLTGHPAKVYGFRDRGLVAPGYAADLVAFDPDVVGTGPMSRVRDLPAGADRLIMRGEGIQCIWVNGVATRRDGIDQQSEQIAPGRVLRST